MVTGTTFQNELVPLSSKLNVSHTHKMGFWYVPLRGSF